MRRYQYNPLAIGVAIVCLLLLPLNARSTEYESSPVATDQAIPFKKLPSSSEGLVSRIGVVSLLGMVLCIAASFALKKTLQRKGLISDTTGTRISVLDTKRITPKLTVFLLKVDCVDYVLVQSGDELQLVVHQTEGMKEHANA